MDFRIRAFQPEDLPAVARVCLMTGHNGRDASSIYRDPELLGSFFTSPYAVLEPDLAFVLIHAGPVCGYVLGTRDSEAFRDRCEREWFPALRQKYSRPDPNDASADAWVIRMIHTGRVLKPEMKPYPAHMHMDLLPLAQGRGWGRKMMQVLLDRLRELNVAGVHLDVGIENKRAIGFYQHMGFEPILEYSGSLLMGKVLGKVM